MQKPSLGWQSWSPPFRAWHGFPRWDYAPLSVRTMPSFPKSTTQTTLPIRYWCSWYAYGWDIDNRKITQTLEVIKNHKLPFTHILIDDGWTTWGDWHTPNLNRFPNMASTVKSIRSHKLAVGLWFAPFLANKKSVLFKTHPEWFVKYKGRYVQGLKTMPIWEWLIPQQYLLNLELPEVKKYLSDFIDLAINQWGITLLKLDFLYAPYFDPNHKSDHAPHNQIAWILSYIKQKYPKVQTIACGTPFSPALGIANIIRVSKDTALPPFIPTLINRLIYKTRVKMLSQKLQVFGQNPEFVFDPDVRLFSLDVPTTQVVWDTALTMVLGIGDNLTTLPQTTLNKIKLWLNR